VKSAPASPPAPVAPQPTKRNLTNKEREALKTLPGKIQQMEAELEALSKLMASADYYQDPNSDLSSDAQKLEALENQILQSFQQLEQLES